MVNGVHPDSGFAWQARAISSGVHAQGPPHALHLQVHCPPPTTSHQPCVGVGRRPKYSFTDECCGRAGSRDSLWSVSPPPLSLCSASVDWSAGGLIVSGAADDTLRIFALVRTPSPVWGTLVVVGGGAI